MPSAMSRPMRAGGHDRDLAADLLPVLEAHDGALAELLLNAGDGELERFCFCLSSMVLVSPQSLMPDRSRSGSPWTA